MERDKMIWMQPGGNPKWDVMKTVFTFHQFCHLLSGPPQLLAMLVSQRQEAGHFLLVIDDLLLLQSRDSAAGDIGDHLCKVGHNVGERRKEGGGRVGAGWCWNPLEDHSDLEELAPHQLLSGNPGALVCLSFNTLQAGLRHGFPD